MNIKYYLIILLCASKLSCIQTHQEQVSFPIINGLLVIDRVALSDFVDLDFITIKTEFNSIDSTMDCYIRELGKDLPIANISSTLFPQLEEYSDEEIFDRLASLASRFGNFRTVQSPLDTIIGNTYYSCLVGEDGFSVSQYLPNGTLVRSVFFHNPTKDGLYEYLDRHRFVFCCN